VVVLDEKVRLEARWQKYAGTAKCFSGARRDGLVVVVWVAALASSWDAGPVSSYAFSRSLAGLLARNQITMATLRWPGLNQCMGIGLNRRCKKLSAGIYHNFKANN